MMAQVLAVGAGVAAEAACGREALVHSVFPSTVNIKTEDDVLLAITTKTWRHYYSLNISGHLPTWPVGEKVALNQNRVGHIHWDHALPWSCKDTGIPLTAIYLQIEDIVRHVQENCSRPGLMALHFDCNGDIAVDPVLSRADQSLDSLLKGLATGNKNLARSGARQLAGLGPGLTPAGDDLIAGLLASLYWLAPQASQIQQSAPDIVDAVRENSNLFSAQAVSSAANGELPEPVFEVLKAVMAGSSWTHSFGTLISIGNTSGLDMLAGICFAIKLTNQLFNKGGVVNA